MKEANDEIYVIPGEGLFCLIRTKTAQGYFNTRGLESLILTDRRHDRDTEELERKLFTLRKYNQILLRPEFGGTRSPWGSSRDPETDQQELPA